MPYLIIQYLSDIRYNAFFVQIRSLHVWTCSKDSLHAFDCRVKRVQMRSQTRSNEKPHAFIREAKCIRTRTFTRLNENVDVFTNRVNCVRTTTFTRSNVDLHAFERGPARVRTRSFTHSNEDLHAFERGTSRVRTRQVTRSLCVRNSFAIYLVSDGYCSRALCRIEIVCVSALSMAYQFFANFRGPYTNA